MAATRLQAEVDVSGWSDAQLVNAGSTGDRSVFVELYRRHAGVARRVARGVAGNDHDAADAAAEAFARVFDAIVSGRAPAMEFRAYLITATRNAAIDQLRRANRRTGHSPSGDDGDGHGGDNGEAGDNGDGRTSGNGPSDALAATEDSKLVAQAFQGLPSRWQSVLWLTEVEGVPAREAATLLGLSPNNVAQLAVRARARLRERYLQAHVRNHAQPRCQRTVDRLGAYLAGTLAEGQRARVDDHLQGCAACRERLAEVEDLGLSLRRALVPVPLLAGALGWLRRGRRHRQRRTASTPALEPDTTGPAPVDPAPGGGMATSVSSSPLFESLASMPVSAAVPLIAVGEPARWVLRGGIALLAALPFLGGIGADRSGPVAVAVASPAQPATTTTTVAPPPPVTAPAVEPAAAAPEEPDPLPVTAHPFTTVAQAQGPVIDIYASDGVTVTRSLGNPQPSGAPLVFVVVDQQQDWLRVLLPTRPNGSTGWVRRQDVTLSSHTFSIVVELAAHRITVFNGTHPFLSEPVAVGTTDTPTPGGLYYIKELIRPVDSRGRVYSSGPYGPYAYGLSGFSDVLADFAGGDGVIGIHGNNDPSVLGHDVSHGCIRMSNAGITRLAGMLPLGVPVEIRA
ncbi:MAG TPA: sigma-70 family RNA polymerase sigma factor [Acidimicrobiales bacterium]|nr:sigma-70 family RNA polymerase sigma factor [Acidimicrobiales bacterium]